jgi:hypothetical protein
LSEPKGKPLADDPNPALRAELNDALTVLAPQIRGLHDLAAVSISADLAAQVKEQINDRERRWGLIERVLAALDNVVSELVILEADGYPSLPNIQVAGSLFEELQVEVSDVEAAAAVFESQPIASRMTVDFGTPADKPGTTEG